ncbi:DUF3090 family protein [Nitrolancea hollandica]|uniref:DUF3090 family protein n=1 Tax=Nitrolancea hollandica Lb TaxID=1129897 RepID=I4EJY0_9BACT|nr:DUF3090 family protein [Nitrolancea hollandica]CCF84992.1 conserved hypothetical protein [Nitrolancea hollandica Lb]
MAFEHHEYDLVTVLEAEALGEPGERRFRVIAGIPTDVVSLWMEKEQLHALGLAIEQLVTQLLTTGLAESELEPRSASMIGPVPISVPEYMVGKMAIGYDEERRQVAIFAHDVTQEDDEAPVFAGRVPLPAAIALAGQITDVVAAGRPRCPRCHAPIEASGHVCPHNNGHLPWSED